MDKYYDIVVVGAGPAGMMAAGAALEMGAKVLLLDKLTLPGKKLLITGKGRCNVTNNCDIQGVLDNVPRNPRFLYSAYDRFNAQDSLQFFQKLGLAIKKERGNRVFPASDKSSDVIRVLEQRMKELGVTVFYRTAVSKVVQNDGRVSAVQTENGKLFKADACIVANRYPSPVEPVEG